MGMREAMLTLQMGHLFCFDACSAFPQSMHTHMCPHGIIIVLDGTDIQNVHSYASSTAAPYTSLTCPLLSISSGLVKP